MRKHHSCAKNALGSIVITLALAACAGEADLALDSDKAAVSAGLIAEVRALSHPAWNRADAGATGGLR